MAEVDGAAADLDDLTALALLNYGHFTSMRVDGRCVRGLSRHLARLTRDCHIIFDTDLDEQRVREFARRAVGASMKPCVVRVTVFDPAHGPGGPGFCAAPRILTTTRPAAAAPPPPLRVMPVRYGREMPAVKHVGLFGALWQRRVAQLNGYDDALFTDAGSVVSEGVTWNIGFFDGADVVWPESDCLAGVTMDLLKEVHGRTRTAQIKLGDIPGMQAAFATNAAIGVRAISAIGDLALTGHHPILEVLRREYAEVVAEPL
jgi:branched-subunit amino acid aminotransferase/4-amino-4-deoxychorismate lyase